MPGKPRNYKTMTEALRAAIAESELSFQALERETGVKRQSMMRFVDGEQSLRLDVADKLAAYFGLEIVKRKGK
jgi:plasmid maintenance system antidote protein VapI